jgi:cytochrome c oxidase cbb3-type subunit 4
MPATYDAFAHFAQTWGLAYFVCIFVVVVAYALWPWRKKEFDQAAQMPLSED